MAYGASLHALPDELLLRILYFLDIPELVTTSRTSRHLRLLSLDPLLHKWRLKYSHERVGHLLPRRPLLAMLQPPVSTIYLTRTHLAARRLHWSLVCIRLNRSLLRRPKLSTLVAANILPKECCRLDRDSGTLVWGGGGGTLADRKRKIEREQLKEGLRVYLERKARQIGARKREVSVGMLAWSFSRKMKTGVDARSDHWRDSPRKEKVSSLKRFFEGLPGAKLAP